MADRTAGWLRFFVWGVAGACFALGISAVGLFTVPLGVLVAVLLRKAGGRDGELLGLLEGVGAIILLVGARNLDGTPLFVVGGAVMLLTVITYWWTSPPRRNTPSEGTPSSLPD
jgi:hypothetical protein